MFSIYFLLACCCWGSSPGAGTIPSRVVWWGVQGASPNWENLQERQQAPAAPEMLAAPGWDQEQQQPNPPTPTKETLGKHLETRNAVTRADGTEAEGWVPWRIPPPWECLRSAWRALSNLSLLMAEEMVFKAPSNTNHSRIPWFPDSLSSMQRQEQWDKLKDRGQWKWIPAQGSQCMPSITAPAPLVLVSMGVQPNNNPHSWLFGGFRGCI